MNYEQFEGSTPRPWNKSPSLPNCIIGPPDGFVGQNIIATLHTASPGYSTEANANLIIAAPDLLAENKRLREMLQTVEKALALEVQFGNSKAYRPLLEEVQAALQ